MSRVPQPLVDALFAANSGFRLTVQRNGNDVKERKFCVYTSIACNNNFGVHNASVDGLVCAILERSFFVEVNGRFVLPLKPIKNCFERSCFRTFRNRVIKEMAGKAFKNTLLETVNLYHGAKYRRYLNAYLSLCKRPLTRKDRELENFGKFEKVNVNKATRVINPPSARYGLCLASYLKHIEHKVFEALNKAMGGRTDATVIKGMDVYDSARVLRQKWDLFKDPVAIGLDAVKYDAHFDEETLKYEHSYYTGFYPNDLFLVMLLLWQLTSVSIGRVWDGVVRAWFRGKRCSGDINTSLGNCIIMCAIVYCFFMFLRICAFAELANNGDDCVVIMEREHLNRFLAQCNWWFSLCGFRVETEKPVFRFEEIEFCQAHPVFDGTRWRMVRNPIACMTKDPMCLKAITTPKALAKWRNAVGTGGLSLASGIPVLQSFYDCMRRGGGKFSQKYFRNVVYQGNGMEERGATHTASVTAITPECRASFAIAFGINPSEQLAIESYYDQVKLIDELSDQPNFCPLIVGEAPVVFNK